MASLGGEITATFVNPAGLGMYKTSEFVFSPGLGLVNSNGNFRGTGNSAVPKTAFNLGTSGFVFGGKSQNSKWTSTAVSFAVNRTASFNNAAALGACLPGTAVDDLPAALMSFLLVAGDMDK